MVTTYDDRAGAALAAHGLAAGDKILITTANEGSATPDPESATSYLVNAVGLTDYAFFITFHSSAVAGGSGYTDGVLSFGISFSCAKALHPIDQNGWADRQTNASGRWEPMHDWSPNGCLTVLEELKD